MPARPQVTMIGQRPGVVFLPTFQLHATRVPGQSGGLMWNALGASKAQPEKGRGLPKQALPLCSCG